MESQAREGILPKISQHGDVCRDMSRRFDHIDLRLRSLAEVRSFYEQLLLALEFTRDAQIEGWLRYEAMTGDKTPEFVGVTESPHTVPTSTGLHSGPGAALRRSIGWNCSSGWSQEHRRAGLRRASVLCGLFRGPLWKPPRHLLSRFTVRAVSSKGACGA